MNNILKILKSLEKNESAQKLLSKDFKGLKDSFLIKQCKRNEQHT